MSVVVEVPVFNIQSAVEAARAGAHRIELCDNPAEGGTTPSYGIIKQVLRLVSIDVLVMVRPRGGNFIYSDDEFAAMQHDVEACKSAGVHGIVFGILNEEGRLDVNRCSRLIDRARPMQVTLHRAFDVTRDADEALEDAIRAGFDRILTSGQRATAIEGAERIASLVRYAGNRIVIMAGSGITPENVVPLVRQTGVREIHCSAREWRDHSSRSNEQVSFNVPLPGKSGSYKVNEVKLKQILNAVDRL
ncbi:MAG: copper homeostasis protein CutC [Cyclobacteriaceae bacterium]|nr:copper homeostasis protein CutC [Cyclobacteriaceae bacterium]